MKSRHWPIIYRQLERYGEISRNFALSNYISRLASRIADLEQPERGWAFKTEHRHGDYVYIVTKVGVNHLEENAAPKQLTLV